MHWKWQKKIENKIRQIKKIKNIENIHTLNSPIYKFIHLNHFINSFTQFTINSFTKFSYCSVGFVPPEH